MRITFRKLVLAGLVALLAATAHVAGETDTTATLTLDRTLGDRSLEKIADGSAAAGESRLGATAPAPAPAFPFLPVGAFALAVIAFIAGRLFARRSVSAADDKAPVAQWLDAENLQDELAARDEELRCQRDAAEGLNSEHNLLLAQQAERIEALTDEKAALHRELQALRMRMDRPAEDGSQEQIDALRAELERLHLAADVDADNRLPGGDDEAATGQRFELQQSHIRNLEELLQTTQEEADTAGQVAAEKSRQIDALTETLAHRESELAEARREMDRLRESTVSIGDAESRAAMLDDELGALRDEMNELLGKTGQYQVLVPELETRLFHHQEQIGALESDLRTTAEDAAERERLARQWEAQTETLQGNLDAAESRIATLDSQLAATKRENELLREGLESDDTATAASVSRQLLAAEVTLDEARLQSERLEQWNSTVESLRAEIRRKTTLIDSQADYLANQSTQIDGLRAEIAELRGELAVRTDESDSLRALLAQAGNVVVSLRDEMGDEEHAETRLRLARNPVQDPFGHHADGVDPVVADIEALRFTARSRRDLGDSLETILEEERAALHQASRRVSERDEELTGLKNELSANRLTMVALQSQLGDLFGEGDTTASPVESKHIEREFQQSMKVVEALRTDLQKWRGRVKPLHEALVARNDRIHYLEAEVTALRQAQGLDKTPLKDDAVVGDVVALLDRAQNGESPEAERSRCLDEMKQQWDRIVSLETELADTGARLARLLELDEARCRQIESLELARTAQFARIAELRSELAGHGIDNGPDVPGNVVDLGARRPS